MDGAMGLEEEVVEAVLTCEGDFHDPELLNRIERFRHRLKDLLLTEKRKLQVKKIEPWNSVKVTFTIPREAALRLRQLAQTGNDTLRQMGVLSVQIQGDSQISLTFAGGNNEPTQVVLRTSPTVQAASSSLPFSSAGAAESGRASSDELGSSPGPSNEEVTRKNIAKYLRDGPHVRRNAAIFDKVLVAGAARQLPPAVAVQGLGLGAPPTSDPVPGPSNINPPFRPNNVVAGMAALPSQRPRGSQINSSFSFSKSSGAFHPPRPRLPSAGQSTNITTSSPHMQLVNTPPFGVLGSASQSAAFASSPLDIVNVGTIPHSSASNVHNFNPGGPMRLSPVSSGAMINPSVVRGPPSSSPSSSFIMDLPPPPPYPHATGNTPRPGKQVTASSPLLVNLLQTDPLAVGAGMASGNPNKPISAGDSNGGAPPKKKRRPPKKDGIVKPQPVNAVMLSGANRPGMFVDIPSVGRVAEDIGLGLPGAGPVRDSFSVDLVQSRVDGVPVGHIPDSFIPNLRPDSKHFSADRPFIESRVDLPPSTGLKSDTSVRSAIGPGIVSSTISNTDGQDNLSKDGDPFSLEIAAGKIINPYTGKLEPRDSVPERTHARLISQEDNIATHMLAKKAKELGELSKKSVPISASPVLDMNVIRPFPSSVSVTASTAAVSSGGPSQAPGERLVSSVPSHRRNLISDGSHVEGRDGSAQSNIYAATSNLWQEVVGNGTATTISLPHSLPGSLPQRVPANSSSLPSNKSFVPGLVTVNGPVPGAAMLKHNVMLQQHQHRSIANPSLPEHSNPSGSVIYSSVTVPSSSSAPPHSHSSHRSSGAGGQLQSQQHSSQMTVTSSSVAAVNSSSSSSSLHQAGSRAQRPVPHSLAPHLRGGGPSLSTLSSSSSSMVQISERLKSDSNHTSSSSSNQQNQAASSEVVGGGCFAAKTSSPNLLNSLPDKNIDSQSSTESPPENKLSSEGDENSNHSVTNTDNLPESSGTAALLEHSGVKSENHDSGIGSSSERSDDTPSEPGDGEFRSAPTGTETDEASGNKAVSSQKVANCKLDSKLDSSANTITVGYMMSPGDIGSQAKPSFVKDSSQAVKPQRTSASSPNSEVSSFLDSHLKSVEKSEFLTGTHTVASVTWSKEPGKLQSHPGFSGLAKQNGPVLEDLNYFPTMKMNGPSSHNRIEKMIMDINDLQQKRKISAKHNAINKGLTSQDIPHEHMKLQAEVFEKMAKLHQLGECSKDDSELVGSKPNSFDKSDSPDALAQRIHQMSDERPDHLSIYEVEEFVNGKMANSNGGEGKGGSNITSIYSKRSSPVNVNMLNHIYAPGLPLPRRLTESVQRLVKPLPASESSMPQVRPCKSPGSGGSPRAGTTSNGQSLSSPRLSQQSGARSPGASMPKLIPSDRHSLLSGGLDLAGLQFPSSSQSHDQAGVGALVNCKKAGPLSSTADILLRDPHLLSVSLPTNQHSPPNLFDGQTVPNMHSSKMLSQSFPPHKSRDLMASGAHMSNELLVSLHQHYASLEMKNSSPTFLNSQLLKSGSDLGKTSSQELRNAIANLISDQPSSSSQNTVLGTSLSDSTTVTSQARLHSSSPASVTVENSFTTNTDMPTHSSSNNVEAADMHPSTHSSTLSPVMPVLQRGLEPPLLAQSINPPPTSSQPSASSSSSSSGGPSSFPSQNEISLSSSSSSSIPPLLASSHNAAATTTTPVSNKYVPYSLSSVISCSSGLETVTLRSSPAVSLATSGPPLPPSVLEIPSSSSTAGPTAAAVKSNSSVAATTSLAALPAPNRSLSPPKLHKSPITIGNVPLPASPRSGGPPIHNRNIFESVTGSMSHIHQPFPISCSVGETNPQSNSVEKSSVNLDVPSYTRGGTGHNNQSDSVGTVLFSSESTSDKTSLFNVSLDMPPDCNNVSIGGRSETANITSIQTAVEPPKSESISTEVVNLDFSLSQLPPPLSTVGSIVQRNGCLTNPTRSGLSPPLLGSSLSQMPSVNSLSTSPLSLSASRAVPSSASAIDSVVETIASVAAGRDDSSSHRPLPSLPTTPHNSSVATISSPMKEPVLATMASSLGSPFRSTKTMLTKSLVKTKRTDTELSSKEDRGELSGENKMVTIQSSSLKDVDFNDSANTLSVDSLGKRATRKRKLTGDSKEGEGESTMLSGATTLKQQRVGHSPTAAKQFPKAPESVDNKGIPAAKLTLNDAPSAQINTEKSGDTSSISQVSPSVNVNMEEQPSNKGDQLPAAVASDAEDKSFTASKEEKSHRSAAIAPSIPPEEPPREVHSQGVSGSDSSKDVGPKENRLYRTVTLPSSHESKEVRHRTPSSHSASGDEKESVRSRSVSGEEKESHSSHRASSASSDDHADAGHKDGAKVHRSTGKVIEEVDGNSKEKAAKVGAGEDAAKERVKAGKDAAFEKGLIPQDKVGAADARADVDGGKKTQRVKRQFYAYVPEKSIDQTYFDTPILSGRTRSKNTKTKPSDAPHLPEPAPATQTPVSTTGPLPVSGDSAGHNNVSGPQPAAGVKTDGSSMDSGSGKRSTRSLRVKENVTDQSASKRRRGNQREQR
ncbi:serine-rich adhesin for platelets isoform X2 [Aplysia californica]|uniref:Serine-rich adhesin for platelets isoform X2 n=1 Tax=Aplysia californica TaxID=6500 RepID=A0ABM0JLA3_APLCA|nr:serine-rich adhesin for platelets isoform X2 [Aplysia californica]